MSESTKNISETIQRGAHTGTKRHDIQPGPVSLILGPAYKSEDFDAAFHGIPADKKDKKPVK
jgi:hypothetical protein